MKDYDVCEVWRFYKQKEKMCIRDRLKAFKASNKTGLVNAVKNVMKGAFTEGSEEVEITPVLC